MSLNRCKKPDLIILNTLRKFSFTLIFLFTLFSTSHAAQQTKISIVTEHLPPYQVIKKDNRITGFSVELIHEVMRRSGYSYTLNGYSWTRSYNLTLQKPNYCIFSIARIPERENLFTWIGSITEVNNAVIWGLKNQNRPKSLNIEHVKDYLVAVNRNDVTHLGLVERGFSEDKNLYVLENTDLLLNLLITRPEIDFIVADDITIGYRAKLAGVDLNQIERVLELKDLPLNFYLACNKRTDQTVIDDISASLKSIHQDGFYKKTLEQWQDKMVHIK